MAQRIVKDSFTYRFGTGLSVEVPAGAYVSPIKDEPGLYWVDPVTYPAGSLERHDATTRGIRVAEENTTRAPDLIDVAKATGRLIIVKG